MAIVQNFSTTQVQCQGGARRHPREGIAIFVDAFAQRFNKALAAILAAAGRRPGVLIAALSGGVDSVVLLHCLADWSARTDGAMRLVAAHLNHGLRGADADGDEAFCRRLAETRALEFATQTVDAAQAARDGGMGVEEAGRILRQRFFHDLDVRGDAIVLTGHHADDQVETILMNLRRGAHRRGLSGMRPSVEMTLPHASGRIRIGRPLLGLRREEIRRYAETLGLEWREDASNRDPSFLRNRIRLRIVPALEQLAPGFSQRLLERAERLAREEDELSARGGELHRRLARREGGGVFLALPGEALARPEVLAYALRETVEQATGGRLRRATILAELCDAALDSRTGREVSLPGGWLARRERDGLFFFPPGGDAAITEELFLPAPPFVVTAGGLMCEAVLTPGDATPPETDRLNKYVEWLNPEALRGPLRVRPIQPGDRFRPLGAPGSRKVQDILVDLKIPRRMRSAARAVVDAEGIVWLWPHRLAERVRLRGSGQALRLRLEPAAAGTEPLHY